MSEGVLLPKGRVWASQSASERAAKRAKQKAAGARTKGGLSRGREGERANVASEPNKKRRVIIPLPRIKGIYYLKQKQQLRSLLISIGTGSSCCGRGCKRSRA